MTRKFPYTIVVAEDFDDTRIMVKQALEMRGYHVLEATNGQEAVEIVQKKCPDLILMDLNMPKLDGLGATEQIRECRTVCEDVPILAITAYDTIGMKDAALKAGCSGYITKPLDFERLEGIISRILASS
jgi:two-component system cell cycle response regulator DivK